MAKIDKSYHTLLEKILKEGFWYNDVNRKGIRRLQIPHYIIEHDFNDGFPAITTKKLYWKGVVGELLWMLRGDTNIKYLNNNNIHIWDKDAKNFNQNGSIGRGYGAQWRSWRYIASVNLSNFNESHYIELDQISTLIKGLNENPMDTQHIVTAWNPSELNNMALPPCHWSFEILVEPLSNEELIEQCAISSNPYTKEPMAMLVGQDDEELYDEDIQKEAISLIDKYNIPKYQFTLKWHQRSVDVFLGLPFNIASYALLAHIIGKLTNMVPKAIIGDLSNVHIYEPHLDAVKEQMFRDVNKYNECHLDVENIRVMKMGMHNNFDSWLHAHDIDDFKLINYKSHSKIEAEMLPYD